MRKLTCFVIMPSGKNPAMRLVEDARHGLREVATTCNAHHENIVEVEFGKVYKHIILKAIERVNREAGVHITCQRGEDLLEGGPIVPQCLREICCADITITDVTGLNPNVLLKLGIRLSLRDSLNIIIRHKRVELPFDIKDQRCIDYSLGLEADDSADEIARWILDGLPALLRKAPETTENFFRRTVELATGRELERRLAEASEAAPALLTDLVNDLRRLDQTCKVLGNEIRRLDPTWKAPSEIQLRSDPKLRDRAWNVLETLAKTLRGDPAGLDRAIELYRLLTALEGFREKCRDVLYELEKICAASDRNDEAKAYLEKAKELED